MLEMAGVSFSCEVALGNIGQVQYAYTLVSLMRNPQLSKRKCQFSDEKQLSALNAGVPTGTQQVSINTNSSYLALQC